MNSKRKVGEGIGPSTVQVQMVKKLDKMEQQLEEVLKRVQDLELEMNYPLESKIKKSYINRLKKIEKSVKSGQLNVTTAS